MLFGSAEGWNHSVFCRRVSLFLLFLLGTTLLKLTASSHRNGWLESFLLGQKAYFQVHRVLVLGNCNISLPKTFLSRWYSRFPIGGLGGSCHKKAISKCFTTPLRGRKLTTPLRGRKLAMVINRLQVLGWSSRYHPPLPEKKNPEVKKFKILPMLLLFDSLSSVQSLAGKEGKSIDQKKRWRWGAMFVFFFSALVLRCLRFCFQLLFLWVVQRCIHQSRNIDDMHTNIFKTHETARVCWKCSCLLKFTYSNFLPWTFGSENQFQHSKGMSDLDFCCIFLVNSIFSATLEFWELMVCCMMEISWFRVHPASTLIPTLHQDFEKSQLGGLFKEFLLWSLWRRQIFFSPTFRKVVSCDLWKFVPFSVSSSLGIVFGFGWYFDFSHAKLPLSKHNFGNISYYFTAMLRYIIYVQFQLCSEDDVVCAYFFLDVFGMIIYKWQSSTWFNLLFLPTVPQIRCSNLSKHIGRVTFPTFPTKPCVPWRF